MLQQVAARRRGRGAATAPTRRVPARALARIGTHVRPHTEARTKDFGYYYYLLWCAARRVVVCAALCVVDTL